MFHAASALRVEYHEIAGYRAATRIARALGRADVVEVLEKSLGDEERAAATVDDALARLAAAGRYSR